MKKVIVSVGFKFDAAHYLPDYLGKCRNMHGHTWRGEVSIEGEVDQSTGMVLDFSIIKKMIDRHVVKKLDHKCLNYVIENPTAENICMWIVGEIAKIMKKSVLLEKKVVSVTIWETDHNAVTIYVEDD